MNVESVGVKFESFETDSNNLSDLNLDLNLYERIPEIENGFPVKIRKYTLNELKPHWHEHLEFLYIERGKGEFRCGSEVLNAGQGDLIVINGSVRHSFTADENMEYICIIVSPHICQNDALENIVFKSKVSDDKTVKTAVNNMYGAYVKGGDGDDMVIMSYIYMLLARLVKNYVSERLKPDEYALRLKRIKKVNEILDYIHENYGCRLTTSQIAEKFYISVSYLCHTFKDTVGKTPIEYINEFRIYKATMLLKNTGLSVSQIAEKVGFENLNYFDRIFKRIKHSSPLEFRSRKDATTF